MTRIFRTLGVVLIALWAIGVYSSTAIGSGPTEAPAGFDNLTNGFVDQPSFDAAKAEFEAHEEIDEGLGPLYNADSCASCHSNPTTGAISQITELRAGRLVGGTFFDHPGGSLINDRAIDASIQERVLDGNNVRTFRTSLNTLGDGFVEAIADTTIIAISNAQPASLRGQVIQVPVLEGFGATAVARFGWKNQHASLKSFAADAYLNEMGITSPLMPTENTSNGASVAAFDTVPDPEDDGTDVDLFATFMRATKAPSRDVVLAASHDARVGAQLFNLIGCSQCHTPTIVTAPAGSAILGGAASVDAAVGDKIIHPFSDFLLHNIGTGDGIVQNGGQSTRNKMRTPPLWGVRTRDRLMHDGQSLTFTDAIERHQGQAAGITTLFNLLPQAQKDQILTFLRSL